MEEIWKDIPKYENLYKISNFGKIKSLNYNHTNKEKILKQNVNSSNYYKITLSKNGERKNYYVHELVAKNFIENKENKKCVNHIDGNKLNNKASNLEWVTYKENTIHAYKNNLMKPPKRKIVQYDKNKNFIKIWNSIIEASREYKTNPMNIINCCKGINKTAKEYIWEYYELNKNESEDK